MNIAESLRLFNAKCTKFLGFVFLSGKIGDM
jgi:hypothetical protein